MYVCVYIYIYIYTYFLSAGLRKVRALPLLAGFKDFSNRKTDSIQHHHPEEVVYRSSCLNSGGVAVSEVTSRRWWCIESLFPRKHLWSTCCLPKTEIGHGDGFLSPQGCVVVRPIHAVRIWSRPKPILEMQTLMQHDVHVRSRTPLLQLLASLLVLA